MSPWLGLETAVAGRRDVAGPARAIVQAMLAFDPEFDDRGPQAITAPVLRPRQPQSRLHVVLGRGQGVRRAEALRVFAQALASTWRDATGALWSLVIAARRLRHGRLAK